MRSPAPGSAHAYGGVDAFARQIDFDKLSAAEFVQLLETLHMLGSARAGIELGSLETATLVDLVARASKEQLSGVAEHSELRSVFLDEIFRRMSDRLILQKTNSVSLVVCWRFTDGDGEGGFDRYQTVIEDGVCVSSTNIARSPDTTITVSVDDFIRMATGNVAVPTMFMTGRVRVKGDYAPAVRLSGYFDIPSPAKVADE